MTKNGTVRSGATGKLIPCCWTECDKVGNSRYEHREFLQMIQIGSARIPQYRIYLFCKERHRELWRNSVRDLGNLPTGSRGMLT